MMQYIGFLLTAIMTVLLVLFFNGNISFEEKSIPPFGKLLNPYDGIWNNGEKQDDLVDCEWVINGVKEPVEIIYDERNVPHIFAENLSDALYAQGFVEARDRYFQMDFTSRAAGGALSEYIGKRTLEIDIYNRKNGMNFAAENAISGWKKNPEKYKELEAYLNGINAYQATLNPQNKPIEYKLLNVEPPKWTALKSALVFKYLSDILCGRAHDIQASNTLSALGEEKFNHLFPERIDQPETVIPAQGDRTKLFLDTALLADGIVKEPFYDYYYKKYPPGIGSNNWAVDGSKTESGYPIFCNDPHLTLSLPSVWYELSIHTPEFNAYGVSIPGMPGIMIGFNEHIAWGETNVGQDVKDFFKIKWVDSDRMTYELDGGTKEATIRKEIVKIKGQDDLELDIKLTEFGPILYTSDDGKHDLAVRWLAHDEQDTAESNTFIDGMQCENYDAYKEATSQFMTPAQNFAYADNKGNIALRVNGKFPKKSDQQGRFVEDGTQSQLKWQSYIPRDENPQIINPKRGFISSANQRSAADDFPYYYNGTFEDYRNITINKMLASDSSWTISKMKVMQNNSYSQKAKELMPLLLGALNKANKEGQAKEVFESLSNWNYEYTSDSYAPTYFELWSKAVYRNTYDEIYALRDSFDVLYPEWWSLTELIKDQSVDDIFDRQSTPEKENAQDIIITSWNEMLQSVSSDKAKTWGQQKPLTIRHIMRIPSFTVKDLSVDGCGDVINATRSAFGPSWRMIVGLGPEVEAYGVFPGGQSGNPASRFFKTGIEKWSKGEYYKLPFVTNKEALNNVKLYSIKLKS